MNQKRSLTMLAAVQGLTRRGNDSEHESPRGGLSGAIGARWVLDSFLWPVLGGRMFLWMELICSVKLLLAPA